MKKTIFALVLLVCVLALPMFGLAQEAEKSAEAFMETAKQPVLPPAEETIETEGEAGPGVEPAVPAPDPELVKQLKDYFYPLQNDPQYYADPKFRKKLKRHQFMPLIKYKPNFGKKVWVKGWTLKNLNKKIEWFGREIRAEEYKLSALEVADEMAPFVRKSLEGSDIDYEYWAERFEEFGRTYVNPSKAGKKETYFKVVDCQNGNYIVVQATKPFKRKMAYFIAEDYDLIIKVLLDYGNRETEKTGVQPGEEAAGGQEHDQ